MTDRPAHDAERSGFFDQLQRLLRPLATGDASPLEGAQPTASLAAFAVFALALYGFVAGLFQGGSQAWIAAVKAPFVVLLSVALCLPSLWLFGVMSGVELGARSALRATAGFLAVLAAALAGLLPVAWLFTVSSRWLGSVVLLHLAAWLIAVALARRVLARSVFGTTRAPLRVWTALFLVVSFQVTTHLQPILLREAGEPILPRPRQLFLEHFGRVWDVRAPLGPDPAADARDASPVRPPAESR